MIGAFYPGFQPNGVVVFGELQPSGMAMGIEDGIDGNRLNLKAEMEPESLRKDAKEKGECLR